MKKGLILILVVALCVGAIGVLAENAPAYTIDGKTLALLTTPFDATPEFIEKTYGVKDVTVIQFPTFSEIIASLVAGRAEYAVGPINTMQYMANMNGELAYVPVTMNASMSMLTRADDEQLLSSLNAAIAQLSAIEQAQILLDGIDPDLDTGITADSLEIIDGADTIRVGISGELPPMDYVDAQGTPRGYNVAYMSEIAKILGVNLEFVQVAPDAKYAALLSGKIDVFFWHMTPVENDQIKASDVYLETGAALMFVK